MDKRIRVSKYGPSGDINRVWWYMIINADKTEPLFSMDQQSVQVTPESMAEYQRACIKNKTKLPPTHIVSPSTGLCSMLIEPVERGIFHGDTTEKLFADAKGLVGRSLHGTKRQIRFPGEMPIDYYGHEGVWSALNKVARIGLTIPGHVTIEHGIGAFESGYSAGNDHPMERIEITCSVFLYEPGVSVLLMITDGKRQVKRWRVESGMMLLWSPRDNEAGYERCLVTSGECVVVTFRRADAFCMDVRNRVCEWTPRGYRLIESPDSMK